MTDTNNSPHRSINHALFQSLRKQRELSNRLNVLQEQQHKKLKLLENRQKQVDNNRQSSLDRSLRKQQIDQSFEKQKRTEIYNSLLFKQLRSQLCASIHHKKEGILQSRKQLYRDMKKAEQHNLQKIHLLKQTEIVGKKQQHKKVKLMQLNCKENIKRYWNERADIIHYSKQQDVLHKTFLLENSMNCIQQLQTQEQKIRQQIQHVQIIEADPIQDVLHQSAADLPEIVQNLNK